MEIITYALGIAFIIMTATFALWHYKWEYDRNFKGKNCWKELSAVFRYVSSYP